MEKNKEEPKEEAKGEVKETETQDKKETVKKPGENKKEPKTEETEISNYSVQIEDISIPVRIVDVGDFVLHYQTSLPEIDFVTSALMDETKRSLVGEIQIETRNVLSANRFKELRVEFMERAREKLRHVLKQASEDDISMLSKIIVNDMTGLGNLEYLLADGNLEEVVVNNSKEVVWIYHKKHAWLKTNVIVPTEDQIMNYASRVAREVGREITQSDPLLDAHLATGDRVNATLFPISTNGNTLTIRRFSRTPWTMVHLISPAFSTITAEAAAFIWLAIEYELSMLVTGGTASGKTSMLNALMPFFPANQRIISMEDTREITLPEYLHWIPLTVRPPTPRGEGEVSILDLVENSLRMRPDRIIVGEVRRKEETEVLFEAMHTGHSVYGTFHALEAREVIDRITSPPMSIPDIVMGSLHLIVAQHLNRRTGQRRTLEIVELIRSEEDRTQMNTLYRWNPHTDVIEPVNPSVRVLEELEMFTGMSESEMLEDLDGKKRILEWLLKKDIKEVNDVGKIITEYYVDRDTVLELVGDE
ncbi:MAG: Flp pilus assembly complex ATPase component TadA [Candidatus Altiarchaeales archaeon]|nr:Flp pilus assembly complex ATPase component TadA [Candidatus Altiarchaeota archaeon]MBU4265736.1 Flp pilus assembly complex ATPase component TadA [Candidatus Altiarchaeota archaeon]MBU4341522.1 Flp pilus assembly complex ATPase component TadA [Candidatus Altiarchaeota archaeon]MBU4436651.1 Flp pilus assembly complex ATPase component TadA [Candidatus Altiarchaeota archaeon]MCG2783374.1 Flp pilus assembly complex ATPase component TadA [Candidatus Altiarchaeales archaeon]